MMADPVQRKWSLPPSWEAVPSGKDNRVYYWNKRTGATTWKFPEEEGTRFNWPSICYIRTVNQLL